MMEDHELLSAARNDLADALKVLLNPGIMGEADFVRSLHYALSAVRRLNDLLRQPNRNPA